MGVKRAAKKSAVTIVGLALVVLGIILMPLPGPGLLVCVAGFAVLATEYTWARAALDKTKTKALEGQKQAAKSTWSYLSQIGFGIGMVAVGIFLIMNQDFPFASALTGSMISLGGVILITSAIVARRHYRQAALN